MFHLLFPPATVLHVEQVDIDDDRVVIHASVALESAICPQCGTESSRVHSFYQCHPADLPWMGRWVRLRLTVRRFFCDNGQCPRRTFAESFPGLLLCRARRTTRLAEVQLQVGLAAGSEAGSRLLALLAMPISGDTLINDIRRLPEPETPTPRVLGIDDWAQLKGRRYDTILVDLETHRPIDLLETSSAESVAGRFASIPVLKSSAATAARSMRKVSQTALRLRSRWLTAGTC